MTETLTLSRIRAARLRPRLTGVGGEGEFVLCERVIDLSEGEVQRVRLHDGAENKTIELSHRFKTRLKTLARP